jgi:hypothetical protein
VKIGDAFATTLDHVERRIEVAGQPEDATAEQSLTPPKDG